VKPRSRRGLFSRGRRLRPAPLLFIEAPAEGVGREHELLKHELVMMPSVFRALMIMRDPAGLPNRGQLIDVVVA